MRSFRSTLALRVMLQALVVAAVGIAGSAVLLRRDLLRGVDATLLEVAEIVARAGADQITSEYHFPPGAMSGAGSVVSLASRPRAQLLSSEGGPLVRSDTARPVLSVPGEGLAQARQGAPAFTNHQSGGAEVRSVIYPLSRVGPVHQEHFLQVSLPLDQVHSGLNGMVWQLSLFGLLGVAVATFLSWRIAGRALDPAVSITAAVEAIGATELGQRVSAPGDLIEFQRMAVAFNGLLQRVEHAVTGTRRFTSDASHELRAPLTVLRGELELALSRPRNAPEYEEVLRRCLDEVLRLTRLADDLLTLTRVEGGVVGGKRVSVDLQDLVERATVRKASIAGARGVRIDLDGSAGNVLGDGDLLLRALDGLVEHAIMASPLGGTVRIHLTEGEQPAVTIADSGPGLNHEDISGVFQRFYRSNRPRSGSAESGLGLSIARAVAISHGGSLDYIGNDPGATFKMSLLAAPLETRSPGSLS